MNDYYGKPVGYREFIARSEAADKGKEPVDETDDDQGLCGYCGDYIDFCGHDPGYIKGGPVPDRYPNEWNAQLIIDDEKRAANDQ